MTTRRVLFRVAASETLASLGHLPQQAHVAQAHAALPQHEPSHDEQQPAAAVGATVGDAG